MYIPFNSVIELLGISQKETSQVKNNICRHSLYRVIYKLKAQ